MSKAIFKLDAKSRISKQGTGASRRLRRLENRIPAIVFGGDSAPLSVSLCHLKVLQAIEHESFYSSILTLNIDEKKQKVVLKDIQRHPYKKSVLHMDFLRVKDSDMITMNVPLHFMNEDTCPGVKQGGNISHHMIDIEIKCSASTLPEFIELDLGSLELDKAIHLSEIKLPKGVELPQVSHGHGDHPVVAVHLPRSSKESDEDESTLDGSPSAATPEKPEQK